MRKKTILLALSLMLGVSLPGWCAPAPTYTVVIDAGHGGKDPGAVGRHSYEKDLNLQLSLLTGKLIKERFPEVKVVYTRTTDVFLALQERANIVNRNNANLFICIHANSSEAKSAVGVETFVLGTEKMSANLDVAMRENSVIKLEDDYKTTYMGFDPNSIDSYIMFELMQNNYMDQSLQFATYVQQRFVNQLHRHDRGVRQAAFWVLLRSACPSILFEMGFISNPDEEDFLSSEAGQRQMAEQLCEAFAQQYKPAEKSAVKPAETTTAASTSAEQATANSAEVKDTPKTQPQSTTPLVDEKPQQINNQPVVVESKPSSIAEETSSKSAETTLSQSAAKPSANTTVYTVQVVASRVKMNSNDPRLCGMECICRFVNGWYKYFYGEFATREEAAKLQSQLRDKFPGCWVTTLPAE